MSTANLLDSLKQRHNLATDAALCRFLQVEPSQISKLRSGKAPLSDGVLIRIHEASGLSIAEIRSLAGIGPYLSKLKAAA